ncbi:hypothetical protein BN946_scf184977.g65 [Trametes cinnabarina]|uniref:Uncharacterized protein n=1 Tax=Pycnoporus cinnabarinus TaxID=5643 RepID=A0A060SD08_PYCCI|nr:hypothetical protein BN946_scf184977.g65 [Trametes cinnabarina]
MSAAFGKMALTTRIPSSSRRNKGKGKALRTNLDSSSRVNDDDWRDAESSTSGGGRSAKRRKLSPKLSPDTSASSTTISMPDLDMDSQQTAVGGDFDMLNIPDDTYLPWVPINPELKESTYVPPGLNALIEDMKRTLLFERSARQKAEHLHAEELRRRRELEREAARLLDANRALEAERSVWTSEAAEALASTLESALVADMSRRLATEVSLTAHPEESPAEPEMLAVMDPDARYSIGGMPGPGVLDIRDGEPFVASENVSTTAATQS